MKRFVCGAMIAIAAPWVHAQVIPLKSDDAPMSIPDVELINQRGEKIHFYTDLVKGKVVAIDTIFTTCKTICPPMGANYGRLQTLLKDRDRSRFGLISISVDPENDTPERLTQWSAMFHAGPEWTLLTGPKPEVDRLLMALRVFTPDKQNHAPIVLVGSESHWLRTSALAAPAKLAEVMIQEMDGAVPATESEADAAEHRYFSDVELVDQDGKARRLYSDVLKGRTVVINEFFTSCNDSCPMMAAKFARLQEALGERLGKDVFLVSISVDPENDTPEKLRAYAERFKARPGWIFLTGSKENLEFALGKLGPRLGPKKDHTTVFLVGNTRTHLWKKANGMSSVEAILPVVKSVVDDGG